MAFDLNRLVRENIKRLTPYSSARNEFAGTARIFLDANENSFGSPLPAAYHRYPDPNQSRLKHSIAELNGVEPERIFIGNGSDEAIDLLFRIFCRPGIDNVVICPPTYGMYEVAAGINDVHVKRADLTADFELDVQAVKNAANERTKLIFICSPNNPTGNPMRRESVLEVARFFDGIVVVDEAYIHFCSEGSLLGEMDDLPNLVVLQTFSKAWGLAGLRVGLAFADAEIIRLFNKVKPPYNLSQIAQDLALEALKHAREVSGTVAEIVSQRNLLADGLKRFSFVDRIYPSEANFILARTTAPDDIYAFLLNEKIVVRNRGNVERCEGCLRITVGTSEENRALLNALEEYEKGPVH